jgi:uncharacterized protein YkwD
MKNKTLLITGAVALILAGCGGGGSSSGTGQTPVPTPTPSPTALQTSVPTPTYVAGSAQLSAYNTLNDARVAYGVGKLAQSALLDTAAANHSQYMEYRYAAADYADLGHTEDPSKSGFTGVNPSDRISYAKYAASTTGEAIAGSFNSITGTQTDPGVRAVNVLLSGPYHRFGVLDAYRDVGIGDTPTAFPNEGGTRHFPVFDLAVAQNAQNQLPATGWVGVWPVDQMTGVMYSFIGESPNPIPENNGTCAGYPVSVQSLTGTTLATTSFTLVQTSTNASVSVKLATVSTDANPAYARANSAYIIPYAPLKLGTQYTAHFVGSANGTAIDKTWTFTTTAQNTKQIYGCDPS